jgi:hypothetical protein
MSRKKNLFLLLALVLAACGQQQITSKQATAQVALPPGPGPTPPPPPPPTANRPSTPTGLAATASGLTINLSWNASNGSVAVTGYIVRRNGTPVGTPVATIFSDTTGLNAGTTYRYTVAAVDANGSNSFLSSAASATTAGTPPPGGIPTTLGWFQIPNTTINSVCAVNQGFPEVAGNEGCTAITDDWSGGVMDTARNRLLIWGGGHSGYAGNEVYALELDTLSMVRLDDPSTPVTAQPATCAGFTNPTTYADGRPSSRHTYNQLAYLPNVDAMFAWGGSQWPCGFFADDTWLFNLSDLSWTQKSHTNVPSRNYGRAMALDPNTNLIYARDDFNLFSYNVETDTWTTRSGSSGMDDNKNAVVDPVRKRYYLHTNATATTLFWYDISSPSGTLALQSIQTTGCSGFIGNYQAGMEYDPIQDRIVGWSGGNTVYVLNPDTGSCTTVAPSGGPTTVSAQGTWGRFRYSAALNIFVVCNSVNENCFSLRLTP